MEAGGGDGAGPSISRAFIFAGEIFGANSFTGFALGFTLDFALDFTEFTLE